MTVDHRTRRHRDVRPLGRDEVFDAVLPDAVATHGDLAARGAEYKELSSLGLLVDGRGITLHHTSGVMTIQAGTETAGVVAELAPDALSDLVQDWQSTMGLAMTSRVKVHGTALTDWVAWEPVLRALLDGRKVHEAGDVVFRDLNGGDLDLSRSFSIDDDREEMANFLAQAGFMHVRGVFDESEMAAVGTDIDDWIGRARPDDGESWWAQDADGVSQAVRVLFFLEKSAALSKLVTDERYQWIADLTGDGHVHKGSAEGLVKPLGITRGLSDLPWHKDCGQGQHAYICNSLTCGISVTGADRTSGALGVVPGSHRANTMSNERDRKLDLRPLMLETKTGDVTIHCSDTLHRAHPPVERPRKVVYSSFSLAPMPGDVIEPNPRYSRAARAELTSVQDRIDASVAR